MGYSRSRTITLFVTLTSITSNTLSSLLFHHLPDDPYRLASAFGWYLHFANLLSITGLVGTIRQHALSIAIFSNYLLLDTLLFSIPRFLALGLLQQLSTSVCASTTSAFPDFASHHASLTSAINSGIEELHWTRDGCLEVVWLAQLALAAGVLGATLLQFVGALWVRGYARALWVRELVGEDEVERCVVLSEEGDVEGARGEYKNEKEMC